MSATRHISKFASILTVSILAATASAPVLAADGYKVSQLDRIQEQTGSLFVANDAGSAMDTGESRSVRSDHNRDRDSAGDDDTLTQSQELWNRFERIRANGP